jgi:hypothetical protein
MEKETFVRVDEWNPLKTDEIVKHDGKLIIIPFDKIFNTSDILNTFVIKKDSYVKRLADNEQGKGIIHYINYFIKFYDLNKELLVSYVKLKYLIDDKKKNIKLNSFIKSLYSILFTTTMIDKIHQMVEDNYYVNLEVRSDKKYAESLEFTNEHAKIMMKISMSMKLMLPIVFHYLNSNNMNKESNYLFQIYEDLFDLFSEDIDIYNKLWISTSAKVNLSANQHKTIWEQLEVFGADPLLYVDILLKEKIISETMFKYTFDKNIVSFNSVVLEKQLGFYVGAPYPYTLYELSSVKNEEGLSGIDKLEMNSNKIDESLIILSNINIKKTIKKIKNKMNMEIPKEEIEYYMKHHTPHKFQVQLVFYFYAKYFGGHKDLNLLTKKQYYKLLVYLKRRLQIYGATYLPQILTGNISGKINSRTIQNTKFLMKIEGSSLYKKMEEKFSTVLEMNKTNLILQLLSTILNTTFTIVDYDNPEKIGEVIEVNFDIVSDEFLNFLNQI